MKKLILTGLALVLATSVSFAQGKIKASNNNSTLVVDGDNANTSIAVAGPVSLQLFYSANTGASESQLTAVGNKFGITGSAGRYSAADVTLADVPLATFLSCQVRAWDSAYASYDLAFAAGKSTGKTAVFQTKTSSTALAPGQTISTYMPQVALEMHAVPEPTTIALGVMGLSTLLFRRRK